MESFWGEAIAQSLLRKSKTKSFVLATGITTSGPIHLGNLREILTGDVVFKVLKEKGKRVTFLFVADDFDPLRKVYPFLPLKYEKYIGSPYFLIPAPEGKGNYSQYFLQPFLESLRKLDIKPKVVLASKLYRSGKMTTVIRQALKKRDEIAAILEKTTGRQIPADWSPFQPLCQKCRKVSSTKVTLVLLAKNKVKYLCRGCGKTGWADFSQGQGKLSWRVDWPARWKVLKVNVEPMGKDHASAGGSYETGKEIAEKIFDSPPPYPISYERVMLRGTGAMHSSTGTAISVDAALKFMSPSLIRYFIIRSHPERHIEFEPAKDWLNLSEGLFNLWRKNPKSALGRISFTPKNYIPLLPRHLIMSIQAAAGKTAEIKRILRQTKTVFSPPGLKEEVARSLVWLAKFASEKEKFELAKKIPSKMRLTLPQKELLTKIIQYFQKNKVAADKLHNFIYETGQSLGLSPKETFRPLYQTFLGKEQGPKLGWFLAILDKKWLVKRLQEAVKKG